MSGERGSTRRWVALGAGVAALVAVAFLAPVKPIIEGLERAIERAGPWGPLGLGVAYAVGCLLLVPASALTLLAGALFGPWIGMAVAFGGATGAAAGAFLIARHVARKPVERLARHSRAFSKFDRAIGAGNWKVVALMRLSPAVPFSASNYLFGLTAIGFVPYLLASAAAMLPGMFLYVFLGHAGMAGASALLQGGTRDPWQWTLLLVGLAATAVVVFYVSRLARRRLPARRAHHASRSGAS